MKLLFKSTQMVGKRFLCSVMVVTATSSLGLFALPASAFDLKPAPPQDPPIITVGKCGFWCRLGRRIKLVWKKTKDFASRIIITPTQVEIGTIIIQLLLTKSSGVTVPGQITYMENLLPDLWNIDYLSDGTVELTPKTTPLSYGEYEVWGNFEAEFPDTSFSDLTDAGLSFKGTGYDSGGNVTEVADTSIVTGPPLNPIDLDVINEPCPVPLPLLGVGAAFGYSRKQRKRVKTSRKPEVLSAIG
jgi:hypothetical protein